MEEAILNLQRLVTECLPKSRIRVDEPVAAGGSYWIDIFTGKQRHTLEYRPEKGFGLFDKAAGYGERPAEIYRSPERAARRLVQLAAGGGAGFSRMDLKSLRELYGHSQEALAKKAGVRQPAISRFEKRGEVKLSTLADTIRAMGGELEIRAHFPDADVPVSTFVSGK